MIGLHLDVHHIRCKFVQRWLSDDSTHDLEDTNTLYTYTWMSMPQVQVRAAVVVGRLGARPGGHKHSVRGAQGQPDVPLLPGHQEDVRQDV
eukprot:1183889-Prorocentrum_minimum.AAC.2